jgi:hypothetical protein
VEIMANKSLAFLALAVPILGIQHPGLAQWTSNKTEVLGMFGPRSLGRSLKPAPRRFGGSLIFSPGGTFIGRGRPGSGMMFPPTVQKYRFTGPDESLAGQPPVAPLPQSVPWQRPTAETARPKAKALLPPEPPPPDDWFRSPAADRKPVNVWPQSRRRGNGPAHGLRPVIP